MEKTFYKVYSRFNREDGDAEDEERGMFYGTEDEVKEYMKVLAKEFADGDDEEDREDYEDYLSELDYEETSPIYQFKDGEFVKLI